MCKLPSGSSREFYLLWLYQMALIMFWLYDRSPNQERTQRLMEKSLSFAGESAADFVVAVDEAFAEVGAGVSGSGEWVQLCPQRLKPPFKANGYRSAEALRHPKSIGRRPSFPGL